jgi:hypothetical protein
MEDFDVIPAKAGIQVFHALLDPGFRRGDGISNKNSMALLLIQKDVDPVSIVLVSIFD